MRPFYASGFLLAFVDPNLNTGYPRYLRPRSLWVGRWCGGSSTTAREAFGRRAKSLVAASYSTGR